MRVIELGSDYEKAKSRFTIMNTAAFGGKGPDSIDGLRQLTKVQAALEDVSEEETTSANGQTVVTRKLKEGTEKIVMEDAPYELLKTRFFGAGIEWLPAASKRVVDTYDTFCAAKEVKAVELVKDEPAAEPAPEAQA